jgi:predicted porin
MGGGLRAGFWLEGAINPDTGTQSIASINGGLNNAAATFARRATVSLMNEWGEARLGRDKTATYLNTEIFDPFGDAGIGAASNLTTKAPPVPTGAGYSTEKRANNMAAYFLPSGIAGGLYGQVQIAAGENVNGQKYMGGRLGYASGPFDVAVAYGQTLVLSAPSTNLDNFNVGASWKFDFMVLSGYYGTQKIDNDKQDNWYIGASAPFGSWRVRASWGQVQRNGSSVIDGQKADQFAVGAVYDLSKRTALYGTWSGINNKGGASFVVGSLINVPAGGAAKNADSQGLEFGIRHAF